MGGKRIMNLFNRIMAILVLGFPLGEKMEVIRVVTLSDTNNPIHKKSKRGFLNENLKNNYSGNYNF